MKNKNLIAITLCILLLFNPISNIMHDNISIQPLDLYEEIIVY